MHGFARFPILLGLFFAIPLLQSIQATILYEDLFDSTRTDCHYDGSTWRVEGGYLKYLPDGGTDSRYWADGTSGIQDYVVEAVGRFPHGTVDERWAYEGRGWATLGRMRGRISGYSLQYDPGVTGLRFFNYTSDHEAAPILVYPLDTDWHHLMQEFRGDSIFYFVDSELVASGVDDRYPGAGWGYGLIGWRLEVWFQYFRVSTKEQISERRPPTVTPTSPFGWTSCNPPHLTWRLFDSTGVQWNSLIMRLGRDTLAWPDARLGRRGFDTLVVICPTIASGDSITVCILALEDFYGNAWAGPSCQTARLDQAAPILNSTFPPLFATFSPPLDSVILAYDELSGIDISSAIFQVGDAVATATRLPSAFARVKLTPAAGSFAMGDVEVTYEGLQDYATGCGENPAERFSYYLFAAQPYLTEPNFHITAGNVGNFSIRAHCAYQDADCRLLLLYPSSRLDSIETEPVPVSAETLYIKDYPLTESGRYRYALLLTDAAGRTVRDPVDSFLIGEVVEEVSNHQPSAELRPARYVLRRGAVLPTFFFSEPLEILRLDGTTQVLLNRPGIDTDTWVPGLYLLLAHQSDGQSGIRAWIIVE